MESKFFIETILPVIIGIAVIIVLILVWLLPVLCSRKNENSTAIFWINIILGWIPPVWLVLLIAALLGKKK